ncbi:MAG: hypothetical protein HWE07_08025 [Cytophagia bacterium]|nr:hypothetical protein [Cytophagia bacterium]
MEYQKIITIPREGPNGYKTNSPSFYWNNPDSIFIFPTSLNKAFLYNKDIQIIKTYEYIAEFTMSFDSNEQQQGGALVKNDLYINTIPYSNPNNPSFTSSTYVSHSLNLDYSELTPFSGYPNKFNNKIIPTSFLGGQIIRAFDSILFINNYYSDEINVYNLLSKRSSTTSLGMTELNHLEGLDQAIDNRGLEIIGIQLKYPNYYNIWYDPYRKQVYRYSRHINPKYDSYSSGQVLKEMERNNTRLLQNTLISLSENGKKQYYNLPFNIEFGFPTKHGFVIKSSKLEDDNHDVYLRLILEQ